MAKKKKKTLQWNNGKSAPKEHRQIGETKKKMIDWCINKCIQSAMKNVKWSACEQQQKTLSEESKSLPAIN